jgi:nicotinamide-nucleotide amidase
MIPAPPPVPALRPSVGPRYTLGAMTTRPTGRSRPRPAPLAAAAAPARRLLTAELLSIGAELTNGETRDTNAYEIARSLTGVGVLVERIGALPDRLEVVAGAFRDALGRVDLVVSTGGLGPTPDDLTREALAAACAETPTVDPELEAWLRGLWSRRGLPFPEVNRKQAWRIPSAVALPNENGTAPGWFVRRPDGRVAVALPGPPREMRPMWRDEALPRLRARGLGSERAVRTLRLTGIGESMVADRLGEEILRRANPEVATYARVEAVDIRLSAVPEPGDAGTPGRSADVLLDEVEARVRAVLGDHVWAHGETTWAEVIGTELARLGWTLSVREIGTGGSLGALLGACPGLDRVESLRSRERGTGAADPVAEARAVRESGSSDVGLSAMVRPRGADTLVSIGIVTPSGTNRSRSVAFLGGEQGRLRAAVAAAARLTETLRDA